MSRRTDTHRAADEGKFREKDMNVEALEYLNSAIFTTMTAVNDLKHLTAQLERSRLRGTDVDFVIRPAYTRMLKLVERLKRVRKRIEVEVTRPESYMEAQQRLLDYQNSIIESLDTDEDKIEKRKDKLKDLYG